MRWILTLTAIFVFNIAACWAGNVEREISGLMQKYGAIGVSVAVVKDDNIAYYNSFGYKDLEDSVPLHTSDLFRIASVSKTFVATAIMQIVEKRQLSLDDDINKYLSFRVKNPKYPQIPITIKMLMCHRSSINDSQGYRNFEKIISSSGFMSEKCFSDYVPGSQYTYCNLNYNLLGAIIEEVTGKRFDQYIQKNILKPLKLRGRFNVAELDSASFVNSYWYDRKKDKFIYVGETYKPYTEVMQNYVLGYSVPYLSAAGGLKISVSELARYMMMHMNNGSYKKKTIISRESERIMREVPVPNHWYALSFSHYNNTVILGEELLGQTGGAHGIHTAMIFHPTKKYGFIVFCNGCKSKSSSMDGHELNFDIIRCLYNNIILK